MNWKDMNRVNFLFSIFCFYGLFAEEEKAVTFITSAEQYMEYRKSKDDYPKFAPPKTVITIYSSSLLKNILSTYNYQQGTGSFKNLYLLENGEVGVFYIAGVGSPALIHKMEEMIAFGVKKFISIGYAGALTDELSVGDYVMHSKALSEDGAGHLYLDRSNLFAEVDPELKKNWITFMNKNHPNHIPFKNAVSWSFPVLFRETKEDVERVVNLGCNTVEMEIAAFFAICQEKQVQSLALYIISDSLANGKWDPHLQDLRTKERIKETFDLALEFSRS